VPFTHVLWLESYDTVTRTFTIAASSSENWGYTYYYRESDQAAPVPVAGAPFTVTVGPKPAHGWPDAGCMGLMAVHTPTIAVTDRMRETFTITATSTISPEVQATTYSFAFAPSYQLNEGFRVYLPVVREE
jgi:hypothetical protein